MRADEFQTQPNAVSIENPGCDPHPFRSHRHKMRRLLIGRGQNIGAASRAAERGGRLGGLGQTGQSVPKHRFALPPLHRQSDRADDHLMTPEQLLGVLDADSFDQPQSIDIDSFKTVLRRLLDEILVIADIA